MNKIPKMGKIKRLLWRFLLLITSVGIFSLVINNEYFTITGKILELLEILSCAIILTWLYFAYKTLARIKIENSNKLKFKKYYFSILVISKVFIVLIMFLFFTEANLRIMGLIYRTRDKEISYDKKSKNNIILCIGDSYTYGLGAGKGQDYPAQLGKMLNNAFKDQFQVINRAVPGQNTTQACENLLPEINSIKPDLIVLLIGSSNLSNQYGYGTHFSNFFYRMKVFKMLSLLYNNFYRSEPQQKNENQVWELNVEKTQDVGLRKLQRIENKYSDEYKNALKSAQEKIAKKDKNATDYYEIGVFYLREKNIEKAILFFNDGIKKFPTYYSNYEGLSFVYKFIEKYDDAKQSLINYLNFNTSNQYFYSSVGEICLIQKNYGNALNWFFKGIRFEKHPDECLYFLTNLYNDKNTFSSFPPEIQDTIKRTLDSFNFDYPYSRFIIQEKTGFYYFSNTHFYRRQNLLKNDNQIILNWVESDVKKILDICSIKRVKVIVLNYPLSFSFFPFDKNLNHLLKKITSEYSGNFIDVEQIFNDLGKDKKLFFESSESGKHPNDTGYKLIAKRIQDLIIKEKLLRIDSVSVK